MARNTRDISFATFNLHNLQVPGGLMYPQSAPYTDEEFGAKAAWAGDMLRRLDADVIALPGGLVAGGAGGGVRPVGARGHPPARLHHPRGSLGRGGGGLRGAGAVGDPRGRRGTRPFPTRCGW